MGGANVVPEPADMQRETVLPEDKREGPSSKRSNYATQNTILKPNLKYEGIVPAPKDHMMVEFGSRHGGRRQQRARDAAR
eukprot:5107060-Prymnesium_polylepis.1